MRAAATGKLALLSRGDREARRNATPQNSRFKRVFEELAKIGISAEPAVYADEIANEVREQLLNVDGVLVWVDPISKEHEDRATLDAMLRDVASRGVWVSADPDVILKMGVKEVLHRTKHLGWGTDTHLYRTAGAFREAFPTRLQSRGPRVLKQNRGNGGQGVWRVELIRSSDVVSGGHRAIVRVLHARRSSVPEDMPLDDFMRRCEVYFGSRRLHCRSTVPIAAARRHDPLLYERRKGRRLRAPVHQGADSAATRRPRLGIRTAGAAHHASRLGAAISSTQDRDGVEVDPANDAISGYRRQVTADYLGCRFSLRPTPTNGRRYVCALRNQCQLGVPSSGAGACRDRASRICSTSVVKKAHDRCRLVTWANHCATMSAWTRLLRPHCFCGIGVLPVGPIAVTCKITSPSFAHP